MKQGRALSPASLASLPRPRGVPEKFGFCGAQGEADVLLHLFVSFAFGPAPKFCPDHFCLPWVTGGGG